MEIYEGKPLPEIRHAVSGKDHGTGPGNAASNKGLSPTLGEFQLQFAEAKGLNLVRANLETIRKGIADFAQKLSEIPTPSINTRNILANRAAIYSLFALSLVPGGAITWSQIEWNIQNTENMFKQLREIDHTNPDVDWHHMSPIQKELFHKYRQDELLEGSIRMIPLWVPIFYALGGAFHGMMEFDSFLLTRKKRNQKHKSSMTMEMTA